VLTNFFFDFASNILIQVTHTLEVYKSSVQGLKITPSDVKNSTKRKTIEREALLGFNSSGYIHHLRLLSVLEICPWEDSCHQNNTAMRRFQQQLKK